MVRSEMPKTNTMKKQMQKSKKKQTSSAEKQVKLIPKLDLSYGPVPADHPFKPAGFDPQVFPWPLKSATVEEVYSAHLFSHLTGADRLRFMDELYRVLVPGGKATVVVPYWNSSRAIQDPLTQWPPLCEQSFLYFNKSFRNANSVTLPVSCDFDFSYGYSLDADTAVRTDDTRPFWIKHYSNAVLDLYITLQKKA